MMIKVILIGHGGLKLMPGQSIIEIILISPSQSNRLTINQGGNLNRGTF